ncbi:MAG TPA: hypothetical protein VGQ65_01460 [Thermoanaerobaculia bacterium]|jgi:hypothetical protein|nr:hypothetical protein [Thermoanaerobaculia bacterium]
MMTLAELYLPDFDQEMTNTRRVLERIPTDKFDYSPHGNHGRWAASPRTLRICPHGRR